MNLDQVIKDFSEVELIREEARVRRLRVGEAVYHNLLSYSEAMRRTGKGKDAIAAMVMDYRLEAGLPGRTGWSRRPANTK